jgi:hypothetical protein
MSGLVTLTVIDDDSADLPALMWDLRNELHDTDLDPTIFEEAGQEVGSKGLGSVAHWLTLQDLGADGFRAAIVTALQWVIRTRRTVRVQVGSDILVLTNATLEQQDRVIEAFIARHST